MTVTKQNIRRPAAICLWAFCLFALLAVLPDFAPSAEPEFRRVRKESVAPGVSYYHFQNDIYPVSFNMLRVQWREAFILPRTAVGDGTILGLEPVSEQARNVSNPSKYAVAAVNGDFYLGPPWDGVPVGLLVVDKELMSASTTGKSSRDAFLIDYRGRPDVDNVVYRGHLRDANGRAYTIHGLNRTRGSGDIVLYTPAMGTKAPTGDGGTEVVLAFTADIDSSGQWRCYPERSYRAKVVKVRAGRGGTPIPKDGAVLSASGSAGEALSRWSVGSKIRFEFETVNGNKSIKAAIGGWPVVVENYRNIRKKMSEPRHPRTVIGYNDQEVIVAVIDGRRAGWSRGMTLYELGELMANVKCKEALNLDGGGSSTMWVRGKIRNKPSDGKERSVANSFVIFSAAPKLGLARFAVDPDDLSILTSEDVQFTVAGQDKYYNPVDFNLDSLRWKTSAGIGSITEKGTFTSSDRETTGYVYLTSGSIEQKIEVRVYNEPPIFNIYPATECVDCKPIHLFEGDTQQFRAIALDRGGISARVVVGNYQKRLKWYVPATLGTIDNLGLFTAGQTAAAGFVTVQIGNIIRQAKITVGSVPKILDGFEIASHWTFDSHPKGELNGGFTLRKDAAYNGVLGGVLRYAFSGKDKVQACYAKAYIPLEAPMAMSVWVKGDGSLHELRMAIRDKYNARHTLAFPENSLKNTAWHQAVARIPSELEGPFIFESVYVLKKGDDTAHMGGMIRLDDLAAHYPPE